MPSSASTNHHVRTSSTGSVISPSDSEKSRPSWLSEDASTAVESELPEKDLESQQTKEVDRSVIHYLTALATPVTQNLNDIDEDEDEEEEETKRPDIDYQRIDDHPLGYPRLAAFLNSDENFMICRKYGFLHQRVLLQRQDELRELENELIEMDAHDSKTESRALHSRLQDERAATGRKELIQRIDDKLKDYDDIVMRTRRMSSLQKATERNYNSVCYWLHNKGPIVKREMETFKKDKDFISLVDAKEGSWFDSAVETALSKFGGRFTQKIFISKEDRKSTEDAEVRLYSKKRIDIFARLVITVLAVALLMAPVVALFSAEESGGIKILIIFLFTMFFSISLSLFTKAKRHEVFAATAAYCAVLVVFLGNFVPNPASLVGSS